MAALLTGCPAGDDGESAGSADTGDTDDPSSTTASTSATTSASTTASTTESTTDSTTASTTAPMTTTASMTTETTDTDPSETDTDTTETDTDTGGVACGELSCSADEYCDWGVNSCGADRFDVPVCTPIPDGCDGLLEAPACGCDGIVYSGACAAAVIGVDVDEDNACATPDGLFECGYAYCDPEVTYCQVQYSDIGGYPNSYGCMPLPNVCDGQPSCGCLDGELCGTSCEESPDGGLIVSCAGG